MVMTVISSFPEYAARCPSADNLDCNLTVIAYTGDDLFQGGYHAIANMWLPTASGLGLHGGTDGLHRQSEGAQEHQEPNIGKWSSVRRRCTNCHPVRNAGHPRRRTNRLQRWGNISAGR